MTDDPRGVATTGPIEPAPGRREAVIACALIGAGLVAAGFLRWSPLRDPAGVVGVPILRGYSEASEQGSFYVYVLAVLGLTAVLARRLPGRAIGRLAGASPLLLCVPAWAAWPERLPMVTALALLAFRAGASLPGSTIPPSLLAGAVVVWGLGFSDLPVALAGQPEVVLPALLLVIAASSIALRTRRVALGDLGTGLRALGAVLVLAGFAIASPHDLVPGLIGAAGLAIGRRSGGRRAAWTGWIVALAVAFSFGRSWTAIGAGRTALMLISGAAGMVVVESFLPIRLGLPGRPGRWLPGVAAGLIAAMNLDRPWFGLLVAGAALAMAAGGPGGSLRGLGAALLTAVLLLATLPGPPSLGIDEFHDGQILSAVWEFETGRALYTEVFPLRSYEFFQTWLARRVAAPSLENYLVARHILDSLPVAGAFLLAYAWTRSLAWSFATALGAAMFPGIGDRGGLPLLFAALGVGMLRSRRGPPLIGLAAVGGVAAFCGFDVIVPLAAGTVAAVLFAGPGKWGAGRFLRAGVVLLAIVGPFTAFVAVWQGPRSAGAYWWLLRDNARNLPAFYGLPLPWGDRGQRSLIAAGLLAVGAWASAGVLAWGRMAPGRRRIGLFLLVDTILLFQRGLGRSDPAHLGALILPTFLLGSLGLWEGLRSFRGRARPWLDRRVVAFGAMVGFAALVPPGQVGPREFLGWVRALPGRADVPGRSAFVEGLVGPGDYLWEMEGGMMNYLHRRHNPTRHALAYCISSPAEQRVAVEALRAHPPRLVAWQYLSGSNDIPNPLRFFVIARELHRRYRPIAGTSFLEPAGPDWPGRVDLEPVFLGPLPLGRLALRWGAEPSAFLQGESADRTPIGPGRIDAGGRTWEADGRIDSRRVDALRLELACQGPGAEVRVTLEFAPTGREWDDRSRVTFAAVADGTSRAYLLPVGCSPGWSFRPEVDRLRVSAPEGTRILAVRGESWRLGADGPAVTGARPVAP